MNIKTKKLVVTAMLIGIILLLGLTKIGMIPLGFINISILAIPVVIGTNLLGLDAASVLAIIGGTGLIAGGLEAAANALISTPVILAVRKTMR